MTSIQIHVSYNPGVKKDVFFKILSGKVSLRVWRNRP